MSIARTLITAVFGALIAFYITDMFMTTMILGTDVGSVLLQNIMPILVAAVAVVVVVSVGFSARLTRGD